MEFTQTSDSPAIQPCLWQPRLSSAIQKRWIVICQLSRWLLCSRLLEKCAKNTQTHTRTHNHIRTHTHKVQVCTIGFPCITIVGHCNVIFMEPQRSCHYVMPTHSTSHCQCQITSLKCVNRIMIICHHHNKSNFSKIQFTLRSPTVKPIITPY